MSTFNGLVSEFPDIRIDFFRHHANIRPPLACFLSHVHSDHLAGLETLRSPFVYCSAATREILLRLEKYHGRINYAKGILETPLQTFHHLRKILKPLPLEAPTTLELQPGLYIQVTLIDANHCPGAVMFLIEGDGKAILYTGDVRCEPWFVNAIGRNPILLEYTCGIRSLDKIYLDTSFLENVPFQTKADGIAELLRQVAKYPKDTVFYIQAWTYGYEDVWVALSKALKSPIHVDDYKLKIYNSLRIDGSHNRSGPDTHLTPSAAALTGYMCGNVFHPGCLTSNEHVRLHSCESGNLCSTARNSSVVRIQPVVARLPNGQSIQEAGVGGGGEDLEREVELSDLTEHDLAALSDIVEATTGVTEDTRSECLKLLRDAVARRHSLMLKVDVSSLKANTSENLRKMIISLTNNGSSIPTIHEAKSEPGSNKLQNVIRFPYSRHSSYPELCHLVSAFKPKDIWPCTVDVAQWLKNAITIESLFGEYCSEQIFIHDLNMKMLQGQTFDPIDSSNPQAVENCVTRASSPAREATSSPQPTQLSDSQREETANFQKEIHVSSLFEPRKGSKDSSHGEDSNVAELSLTEGNPNESPLTTKRAYDKFMESENVDKNDESQMSGESFSSVLSMRHSAMRHEAYEKMIRNAMGTTDWSPIELLSTGCSHALPDKEL